MRIRLEMPTPQEIQKLDFKNPALWVATWFGCGLMRPAPGTWGTIAGLPLGMIAMVFGGVPALLALAVVLFCLGLWAARGVQTMTGEHDSPLIVIDEVVGIILALIPAVGAHPAYIVLAFFVFRLFDVLKPFPVSFFDQRVQTPWGVMMDDVIAALYTIAVITGVQYAIAG